MYAPLLSRMRLADLLESALVGYVTLLPEHSGFFRLYLSLPLDCFDLPLALFFINLALQLLQVGVAIVLIWSQTPHFFPPSVMQDYECLPHLDSSAAMYLRHRHNLMS